MLSSAHHVSLLPPSLKKLGTSSKLDCILVGAFLTTLVIIGSVLGFRAGLQKGPPSWLSTVLKHAVDSKSGLSQFSLSAADVIARPLQAEGAPLWDLPGAFSHGAAKADLGVGMLYYALSYFVRPEICVVIGSASDSKLGFVPILIHRGQVDGGQSRGRTFLVDASASSVALSGIEVLNIANLPTVVAYFRNQAILINYLHIDGVTYEKAKATLTSFLPLLAPGGVITLHGTNMANPFAHFATYQLLEELRLDPCWELVDFKSILAPGMDLGNGPFGFGTAILKRRCDLDTSDLDVRVDSSQSCADRRTFEANASFTEFGVASSGGLHSVRLRSERFLLPDCLSCVPGLGGADCSAVSSATQAVIEELSQLAGERGHLSGAGHAYPYLQSHEFQQRQRFVAAWMQKSRPQRILDLGTNFNFLERFVDFSDDWCPELIISVDCIIPGQSRKLRCGAGRDVHLLHLPMTTREALAHPYINSIAFDAVVCLGCDGTSGPPSQQLESFPRPYDLFLEFSKDSESSMQAFASLPSEAGVLVEKQDWVMPDPTSKGSSFGNIHRHLAVMRYAVSL
jgi:hypothetical protein|mmetsp:Transcript_105718/g.164969  ORF Transcript_105718/g.164969 Transcript_105718/m.164969 type:complete len:569 (+) Transcript_105718:80-1786(+)